MKDYTKRQIENSPSNVGLLYVIMIATYLVISVSIGFVTKPLAKTNGFLYYVINGLCSSICIFTVLSIYFNFIKKSTPFKSFFSLNKTNPLNYLIAILVAGGMMFGFGFVNGLFARWLNIPSQSGSVLDYVCGNVWAYIVAVIVFALLPAILEEAFFRGAIATAVNKEKTVVATITVALTFALYHNSFAQLVYQAIYGAILYLMVKKGGSILPCILAHFLNNFTILTLEFAGVSVNLNSYWCIIFGIVALIIGIVLLFLINGKKDETISKKTKGKVPSYAVKKGQQKVNQQALLFWLPYGILGGLLCLAVAILGVI